MNLRRTVLASTLLALLSLVVAALVWVATDGGAARQGRIVASAAPDRVEVLREWDRRRADAWARSSVRMLRGLYVAGSRTGEADVRMLRRYSERGLRVEGLVTQLLSVHEVRAGDGLLVLEVEDRVSSAEVVGDGFRRRLPADEPTLRRVTLRQQEGGEWLVEEVVTVEPAPPRARHPRPGR